MQKKICKRPLINKNIVFSSEITPLLVRIYQAREISKSEELNNSLQKLPDYSSFKDISKATLLLTKTVIEKKSIVIIGDFDCDGATSSALAVKALRAMGASYVNYLVPNRFRYGYGLTPAIVESAIKKYNPNLIITVDNGITALEGVTTAKSKNIKVIITDHHLAGETLPDADAIINPNQKGCHFPGKNIAGVGVIFYVMCALRHSLQEQGWFIERAKPNLADLLDLVALGTVADVVKLDWINRILVSAGLSRIQTGKSCLGIKVLAQIAQKNIDNLIASDLGFSLAPRLNAAGRLDDISVGIELLLATDIQHAQNLAIALNDMNSARKKIENTMKMEASIELEKYIATNNAPPPVGICLYQKHWHQGVIGILAARIKDKFNRPTIIFAEGDQGIIKGSARSITGLHIKDILEDIHRLHPTLIITFGGHAMAAGLSIKEKHFTYFRKVLINELKKHISPTLTEAIIYTDGELRSHEITLNTAEQLRYAAPWGQGFPEPVFHGQFQLTSQKIIGKKHLKVCLTKPHSQLNIEALYFNVDLEIWPNNRIHYAEVVYKTDVNEFRNKRKLQLLIEYIKPLTSLSEQA